jgi:small subunit ribosomal protein S20
MAHSKQALKRYRQSEKKRVANKNAKTRMKGAIKKVLAAGADGTTTQADAQKRIDKAAKSGAIHKNAASRYKSRVARAINRSKAAAK